MGIGIKTITGIGIAALLTVGGALPAHAVDNDVTTQNLTDIGFSISNLTATGVTATWDATKIGMPGGANVWCEAALYDKDPFIPGYMNGSITAEYPANSVTFTVDQDEDGPVYSVAPGRTYHIVLTCHNPSDTINTVYTSAWFTAPDLPTQTPTTPVVRLLNGNDLLALPTGGFPQGEAWADHCLFRLYKNGALQKSVEIPCSGSQSYTFQHLAAGSYTVTTALRNAAGLSGWSVASKPTTVTAASTATTTSVAPAAPSIHATIDGAKLTIGWGKGVTRGNTKTVSYRVTIVRAGNTIYAHTYQDAKTITRHLTHGTYRLTVTATNRAGQRASNTTNIKL